MYAKNQPVPQKFDFPYQKQQRYSGSFVTKGHKPLEPLSHDELAKIEETAKKLEEAQS